MILCVNNFRDIKKRERPSSPNAIMKEALVHPGPRIEIIDSPIPQPSADQVLIQVVVSGTNPKDWKVPEWVPKVLNQGDDIAGFVHSVGDNVTEFKPGDRVAAFHQMMTPHGSYAEYSIAPAQATFHLPKNVSFEEAATIPLAAMTSAVGLYTRLDLPQPIAPKAELEKAGSTPLIVYGAASAVGSFAIQLAVHSGIHPLICVAGKGAAHVEAMIDRTKGDTIVDYRNPEGDEGVVKALKEAVAAAGKGECYHAFDAVSDHNSYVNLGQVLGKGGKITLVLPGKEYHGIPEHVEQSVTSVGTAHDPATNADFAFIWFRYLARGLAQGWFKPHPHQVVPKGLGGVETALKNLKDGKASAVKYVLRIGETDGAGKL